ncbi:hypothetical protein AB0395_23410 [Streptosporangium sp. NPDC051023]|uniref:hypothetical protein n=1 Tax=Streptosporangium sp. NPDC051023 TaxID=3155410 RepID=UPI00344C0395
MSIPTTRPVMTDLRQARVIRQVVVAASPATIFALLADPGRHAALDGTGRADAALDKTLAALQARFA